jgi:CAAX prenyl protease-like protein
VLTTADPSKPDDRPKWIVYVVPFVLYLLLTAAATHAGDNYPLAYGGAVLLVGLASWWLLRGRGVLRPHPRLVIPIAVGLVGIALWIGLSVLRIEHAITAGWPAWLRPQPRAGFDPFSQLASPVAAWGFVVVRLLGLVVLVPVAEELFWRGFLLRWIESPDWQDVPVGSFGIRSFVAVTVLFAAAHPEWLAAAGYCMILNGLLYWKKDLWSCVVAHAVSNLVLAVYILTTESWWLW